MSLTTISSRVPFIEDGQVSIRKMEDAILMVLVQLGMDTSDPSIKDTPARVVRMLMSFNQPFDPAKLLETSFQSADTSSIVAQSRIPFAMLCEHHLLPAMGHAHIAYLPHGGRVVGLSKLARLVEAVGHEKPSLQETINDRIANLLSEYLQPKGVIVVIQAEHTCMTCRGARAPGVVTSTSIVKGAFRDVIQARQEAFSLMGIH
jgi:GTP cyclohydrolase IA